VKILVLYFISSIFDTVVFIGGFLCFLIAQQNFHKGFSLAVVLPIFFAILVICISVSLKIYIKKLEEKDFKKKKKVMDEILEKLSNKELFSISDDDLMNLYYEKVKKKTLLEKVKNE